MTTPSDDPLPVVLPAVASQGHTTRSPTAGEFYLSVDEPQRQLIARLYVYEIGSYHFNWHPEIEILVILTGQVEVCAGGRVSSHLPDEIVLINPGIGHATMAQAPDSRVLLLHLDPVWFAASFDNPQALAFNWDGAPERQTAPGAVELRRRLAQLILEATDDSAAGRTRRYAHLAAIASLLVTDFNPVLIGAAQLRKDRHRVRALDRMLDHIERHHAERISLADLGRLAGYSAGYVSELFTRSLGMTCSQYITRVRLRQATLDLADPRMKVVDVAAANGFPDVKAFNAAFRQNFGKPPTEYRARMTGHTRAADAWFKERFVARDDPAVLDRLHRLALSDHPPSAALTSRQTRQLRELAASAERLGQELARIRAQVEQTLDTAGH